MSFPEERNRDIEDAPQHLLAMLFKRRPDLWAVSRVLKHCKQLDGVARNCWESLHEEDKEILRDIKNRKLPKAFNFRIGMKLP